MKREGIVVSDTAKLLVLTELSNLNWTQFFAVYRESSEENAADWYPELPLAEALKLYEAGYREYLLGVFQAENGMLLLLEKDGVYRSALRLIPQGQNSFLLEALETHPDFREMGFGKRILHEMMLYLHQTRPGCKVFSEVSRKNKQSIATHRAAGFSAETGENCDLRMTWTDAQLARLAAQEARLDRILAADSPSIEDLRALEAYYESPLWRMDYESDEAGQIPEQVKRGILSEDAIYDVLTTYEELLR